MAGQRALTAANERIAIIYCRVSSTDQEDGTSLETQQSKSRLYCSESAYTVLGVIKDTHTGAELDRPGLNELRSSLRAGRAGVVVAYALDRLSRNQTHLAVLMHEAAEYGARIEFVTEKLDDTPAGRFLRDALAFVAEVEREKTRERTRRGIRARAEADKLIVGGTPLYGYQYDGETKARYIPDEEAAPVVQRIFREVAEGKTLRQVAQGLNAEDIPTALQLLQLRGQLPRGRHAAPYWRATFLHKVLTHPAYMGQQSAFRWHKHTRRERDELTGVIRRVKADIERSVADGVRLPLSPQTCPPLVSAEIWYAARASRKRNQVESKRNNHHPEASLLRGGFALCGYCKRAMNVKPSRGEPSYYCLNNSGRVEHPALACPGGHYSLETHVVDAAIWGEVSNLLINPDHLRRALEQYMAEHLQEAEQYDATLAALEATMAKEKARKANFERAIARAEDVDSIGGLTRLLDGVNTTLRGLTQDADHIRLLMGGRNTYTQQLSQLNQWAEVAAANLAFFTYAEKRLVLALFGVRVLTYRTDHLGPDGQLERFTIAYGFDGLAAGLAPFISGVSS